MSNAEQLADVLEKAPRLSAVMDYYLDEAAAELRRLAAENESAHIVGIRQEREIMALEAENAVLKEALAARGEPVGYHFQQYNSFGEMVRGVSFYAPPDATKVEPLYTALKPAQPMNRSKYHSCDIPGCIVCQNPERTEDEETP
jgi:hypothetical protein